MRFQSGLGSEFSRVYKEGTRVDQLILAQVLKVHYKYNTVDLITIQNHNVLESAYDTEGKFSAKLPIEFGGRNQFDLPYGQVKPIDVGTIVLVGFINESKEAPIVLSAYANAEVSKQLSRAPFSSADPSDEDLRRDMYQNFTLHPSLTYDSINGDGDRVVTFSGRSFISFTSKDTDNSNITDDNYGSDYFDLESSYYGDGDPIEPVEENAPNMLFKHQGIFDKDDEFDNHKLMIHINNDGTYRTSMLDQTEDWRSMFEMTPEGDIRLRRQGDSLSIGDGFEVGEIGIDKHGKVYLRNGGSELTLEEDGLYIDGEPLSASMSDIWDELEDSNRNILENSQNIENVGDSLTVTSKKVEQQGTSIADMSSEITIMAEEISSKVTRAEVDDILDAGLEDISEEIKSVRENAEWAKSKIDGLLDDNYLEAEEKRDLYTEWNLIQTEYPSYMQQASDLEVGSNDYKKAYEDLESTVEPIFEDMESSMVVDGVLIQNRFNAYYDQRMKLLQSFLSGLKDGILEAMKEAADAALDAADAKGDARDAQNAADNANSLIDDIASDGKLTPNEKLQLKREWDTIQREHPSTIEQAEKYNLETLDYENKYNSLESFLEPLLSNLGNTTNVEGEELRKTLADYYGARIDLLKEITDEAKDQLDDYGKRIDVAETNIRQTSERIELIATKVQSVEDDLVTQKGEINVLSDQIQLRVTEDQARNIVQDSMDDLKIGTANLYVVSSQSKGILNDDTGEVETAEDDSVVSTWISVKPNYPYVASLTGNAESQANIITVNFYDSDRSFIEGKSLAEVGDFYMEAVSPNLASYARVSYKYSSDVRIKFESGSKPTDWSMAWDDVLYDSDLLEEYIKDVETQASEAQRAAENAANNADVANEKIADIGSDGKVTPGEKKTLNMQWKEIQAEYPEIRDQAIRYRLSTTNYTNAFNQVKNYVDDLFEDMEETSNVTGESLRGTFSRYYSARTSLLNQVYEKAEQNAKDYSDTEIAKVGERIQQAEDQIDESNKILVDMSKDDVLSPIDKKSLSKEWEQIQSEYPKLIDQGNKYGTNVRDIEASYSALERYLTPILSQMGENTEIDSKEFRSKFKEYYGDKLTLMNSVSDEVRKLGDAAASDAENRANSYTDSQIDITKDGIKLSVEETKEYADSSSNKAEENAKDYSDTRSDRAEQNAKDYADSSSNKAEQNAKDYSDTEIAKVEKQAQKTEEKATDAEYNAKIANDELADLADDDILSPTDKKQAQLQWSQIQEEYPVNIEQANRFNASSESYKNSYETLERYIEPLIKYPEQKSVISGNTFRKTFSDYYTKRTTLLNRIAEIAQESAENANKRADNLDNEVSRVNEATKQAQIAAENAQESADKANQSVEVAQRDAQRANEEIADIADDNVLAPSEKQQLKYPWAEIQKEYPKNVIQAQEFNTSSESYENAYKDLESFAEPLFNKMDEKSVVDGSILQDKFGEYYDQRVDLLNAISNVAKNRADKAQEDLDNLDINDRNILLDSKKRSIERSNSDYKYIIYRLSEEELTKNKFVFSGKVEVTNGSYGKFTATFADEINTNLGSYEISLGEEGRFSYAITSDKVKNATKIYVYAGINGSTSNNAANLLNFKLQEGNRATAWTPAPEDTRDEALDLARKYTDSQIDITTDAIDLSVEETKEYVDSSSDRVEQIAKDYSDSQINMTKDEISLGVEETKEYADSSSNEAEQNAKNYADSQINMTKDAINLSVEETKEYADSSSNKAEENAKDYADSSSNKAEQNAKDYSDTEIAKVGKRIQQAEDQIDESNKILVDMAKDDILSPTDKKSLSKEWEQIKSEYPKLIDQGNKYGVNITDLEASYGALEGYLTPILSQMGENTEINSKEFRSKFKNYYDDKLTLMNSVSDEVRKLGDAAASDAENRANSYTDSQIDITKEGIVLGYKNYTDESSQKVKDNAKSYADNAVDNIDINDRNLLKGSSDKWQKLNFSGWNYYLIGKNDPFYVNEGETYTASVLVKDVKTAKNGVALYLFGYSSDNEWLYSSKESDIDRVEEGKVKHTHTITIPEKVDYITMSIRNPVKSETVTLSYKEAKLQKGNRATEWTPAPEDLVEEATNESKNYTDNQIDITKDGIKLSVEETKEYADSSSNKAEENAKDYADSSSNKAREDAIEYARDVKQQALDAQRAAENAANNADVANEKIADIGDDEKVTPGEKKQLQMQWSEIQEEYPEIKDQATRYSLSTSSYTNAYNQVASYVEDIFENMGSTTSLSGGTLRATFSRYYGAKTTLLNQIYEKAEQNAKDYSDSQIAKVGKRIQQAEDQIDESNKILVDMSKDDLLTPIDKKSLSKEWEQIQSEYPKLIDQGNKYDVNITDLEASYSALERYLTPILSQMGENTEIDSKEFRSKFKEYYDDKLNLMNDVSDEVRKLGDAAASDAENRAKDYSDTSSDRAEQNAKNYADSSSNKAEQNAKVYTDNQIDITKDGIKLSVEETKEYADSSSDRAEQNAKDYSDTEIAKVGERIQQAEDSIEESNKRLTEMSQDNILSPIEKKSLAKEWEQIESEYPKLIGQANSYSVSTSGLETTYTNLQNYVEPLLGTMGDNSAIAPEEFRRTFKDYYDDKLTLMNNISDKVRKLGDAAASDAENRAKDYSDTSSDRAEQNAKNYADSSSNKAEQNAKVYTDNQIDITKDGIKLSVEETKEYADSSSNKAEENAKDYADSSSSKAREDAIEYTKGQISLTKDEFDVNFVKNDELISAFNVNQGGLSLKGDTIELDGNIVLNKLNSSMKASYSYGPPSWGGWDRYFEGIWDLNSNELRFESDIFKLKDGEKGDYTSHGKTYFSADQIKLREYTDGSEGDVHGDLMSRLDVNGYNLQFAKDWSSEGGVLINSDGGGTFNKQIWVGGSAFFGGNVAIPQHLLNARIDPRSDWSTWRMNEDYINGIPRIFFSKGSPLARIEVPWHYNSGNNSGLDFGFIIGKDSRSVYYQFRHTHHVRTYSNSANFYITSNDVIGRATSASKYKLNITHLPESESVKMGNRLLSLNPAKWWDKTQTEDYAEELSGNDNSADTPRVDPFYGLIAEDLRDAGLDGYISYNEKTEEIEGIEYDKLWTILIPVIRKQREDIEDLKKKIIKLEQGRLS